jgi:predicted  nucleic acid-binding Zn-ribbon protein
MYKCNNCGRVFESPVLEKTTYESYYGVSSMFAYGSPLIIEKCPKCDSEDFRYYNEEEEEDE